MKKIHPAALLTLLPLLTPALRADDSRAPWQQITIPTVAEVAANFAEPPKEYRAIGPVRLITQ